MCWISSKQTQWVFWCTFEFSVSFTLSLYNVYIFICLLISFSHLSWQHHHLWLSFSFWYLLGSPFCVYLTACHLHLLCLYLEKHNHRRFCSYLSVSIFFLLLSSNYPLCNIIIWSSTGDKLKSWNGILIQNLVWISPVWGHDDLPNMNCRILPKSFEIHSCL